MNILDELDSALLKQNKEQERELELAHYPSSASIGIDGKVFGKCLRQQYYRFKGITPSNPLTPSGLYPIVFGNIIHKGLQDIYAKEYIGCEVEKSSTLVDIGLEYPIKGRADLLMGRTAIEIKTAYGRAFPEIKLGPKPDHLLQAICYIEMFSLQSVEIAYLARDNFNRCVHLITRGDEPDTFLVNGVLAKGYSFAGILASWKLLEEHLKKNEVPDRDYHWCGKCDKKTRTKCPEKCEWPCFYCGYQDMCHGK